MIRKLPLNISSRYIRRIGLGLGLGLDRGRQTKTNRKTEKDIDML